MRWVEGRQGYDGAVGEFARAHWPTQRLLGVSSAFICDNWNWGHWKNTNRCDLNAANLDDLVVNWGQSKKIL